VEVRGSTEVELVVPAVEGAGVPVTVGARLVDA
jgi:hypothetical protein